MGFDLKAYTLDEAAEILKKKPRTVYTYIKAGKLKAHKVGGTWIIKESNLKLFMTGEKE